MDNKASRYGNLDEAVEAMPMPADKLSLDCFDVGSQ